MALKKKPEEHENHERWLVSYADFITLLFAFFVVMYSISSVNEGKYRVLSDSLVSAFRAPARSITPIQVGALARSPKSSEMQIRKEPYLIKTPKVTLPLTKTVMGRKLNPIDLKGRSKGIEREGKIIERISEEIELALSHLIDKKLITVHHNDLWIEVVINNSILFPSGSARLQTAAVPLLKELARILGGYPNPIRVEGFTDNMPINTLFYPSNWELSAARAASVVRLFAQSKINPLRLAAVGYGENRPIADNRTPEGRKKNRRVQLIILANHGNEQIFSHINGRLRQADSSNVGSMSNVEHSKGADVDNTTVTSGAASNGERIPPATPLAGLQRKKSGAASLSGRAGANRRFTVITPPIQLPHSVIAPPIKFSLPFTLPNPKSHLAL